MVKIPEGYNSKEEYVNSIFASIAHRYDLMNTLMTLGIDQRWRRRTVLEMRLPPGGSCLDVCCGTGKIALLEAAQVGSQGRVVGLDYCAEMLDVAAKNISTSPYRKVIELVQGNAINLPFPDNTFDGASIGFALRNVPDIKKTISEMMRVVKPGGRVVSLELAKPSFPVFKQLYYLYFDHIVPLMGKLGVGLNGPYSYLPNSLKSFPHQEKIRELFAEAGLKEARCYELTGGIVAVHVGIKPEVQIY